MVEMCMRHILMITFRKTVGQIWNIKVFFFIMVLSGVYITYDTRIKCMISSSQDPTIPQISTMSRTKGCISQEKGGSEIGLSIVTLQFSKYTDTTGKTTEMQDNLTQSTTRPNAALIIHTNSTDEEELDTKEDNVRNLTTNHHKATFMTVLFEGRLGNNMFQLAALLSCTNRLNITAIVPANELISSYFLFPRTGNINVSSFKTFHETNWTLSGYYQSWKYFYQYEHLIRKSFKFRPNIYEPAQQLVASLRVKNKTVVGVHVRGGDMTIHENTILGYSTAPISYLHKSMNYFRERYNNTCFIIASDDITLCKENIRGHNDIVFSYFGNAGADLAPLSACDHVIMTSGTFGWWGAWLAGGDVVYFKRFPRAGSTREKAMCHQDYYLPHWIGME
ncbi:hypothetical protein ACJMK2_018755 [Sinanodonta woodiana]|uniref:L-Fucosyltransferase n=1 Tax=Sinanodonta woodiana TaxID=1069815 RepID=A0ABD3UED3_SINWO